VAKGQKEGATEMIDKFNQLVLRYIQVVVTQKQKKGSWEWIVVD
jgi:hypothetical protein